MTSTNPYVAPRTSEAPHEPRPALLVWSVLTVFGSASLGGLLGLAAGAALGTWVPGYYRSMFSRGSKPGFEPVAVGMGQGLTQGSLLGVAVGLAAGALFYWYRSRVR